MTDFGQIEVEKSNDDGESTPEGVRVSTETLQRSEQPYEQTLQEIEWGRFDELQRRFGIRRSTAYELIGEGKIKSVAVKRKGTRSGIRLIDFGSVREFLRAEQHNGSGE